uniref:Uncharacterized protein n=1 Tax=Timema monikensis TaxID=170555 RepID=A0A7R9EEN0_9NEOP|nr:unnamed protein product [Timema monikensis]
MSSLSGLTARRKEAGQFKGGVPTFAREKDPPPPLCGHVDRDVIHVGFDFPMGVRIRKVESRGNASALTGRETGKSIRKKKLNTPSQDSNDEMSVSGKPNLDELAIQSARPHIAQEHPADAGRDEISIHGCDVFLATVLLANALVVFSEAFPYLRGEITENLPQYTQTGLEPDLSVIGIARLTPQTIRPPEWVGADQKGGSYPLEILLPRSGWMERSSHTEEAVVRMDQTPTRPASDRMKDRDLVKAFDSVTCKSRKLTAQTARTACLNQT